MYPTRKKEIIHELRLVLIWLFWVVLVHIEWESMYVKISGVDFFPFLFFSVVFHVSVVSWSYQNKKLFLLFFTLYTPQTHMQLCPQCACPTCGGHQHAWHFVVFMLLRFSCGGWVWFWVIGEEGDVGLGGKIGNLGCGGMCWIALGGLGFYLFQSLSLWNLGVWVLWGLTMGCFGLELSTVRGGGFHSLIWRGNNSYGNSGD